MKATRAGVLKRALARSWLRFRIWAIVLALSLCLWFNQFGGTLSVVQLIDQMSSLRMRCIDLKCATHLWQSHSSFAQRNSS